VVPTTTALPAAVRAASERTASRVQVPGLPLQARRVVWNNDRSLSEGSGVVADQPEALNPNVNPGVLRSDWDVEAWHSVPLPPWAHDAYFAAGVSDFDATGPGAVLHPAEPSASQGAAAALALVLGATWGAYRTDTEPRERRPLLSRSHIA
jgi:hypothetical protein